MSSWNDLVEEVKAAGGVHDIIRRKYLKQLAEHTGRNVIIYYSGWLQKSELGRQGFSGFSLDDADKNGFMATIHGLDRTKGLDLVLHTPGGNGPATESIVDYLRSMFGTDIRAIVPQIALSAGTMIALACNEIVMGKHSSLGPIDPQLAGVAAHGIIEEFKRGRAEVQTAPWTAPLWQAIFAKYTPTLIGECEKSIKWAEELVKEWLVSGMFSGQADASANADKIVTELGDHALTKSHARHVSMKRAAEIGVKTMALESDAKLQDLVLSVHHACIQTLAETPAVKIIENQDGVAYVQVVAQQMMMIAARP
jgi:hypothetical protein